MNEKFLKPYNPNETEDKIYKLWEESGFFNPDVCIEKEITDPNAEIFSIVLPPPNVTGTLHIGHAAMLAIEDIAVRYNRMKGKQTLWIPGTDHAAIATQSKVEGIIYKEEGKRRHEIGREELLKRIQKFASESHDTIINQTKKMGSSLDWSREAFTLDEKRNFAVRTAFKKMFDDGLIYRGLKVINWDPKGQTTVSDDEVDHKEVNSTLYTFKYSKDFPIPISTTRPETKVGDAAVAVHPSDTRYSEFIGKEYDLVFSGVPLHIKIVADESADPEFGTGAVGVTPAHSQVDWEIARRHKLPVVPVINEFAKMMENTGALAGKKTTDARAEVVNWLKQENLLIEEKPTTQNISVAERSGGIIEPLPKLQWFIDVNKEFTIPHSSIEGIKSGDKVTLKKLMRTVVENNQIKIIPDRFEKTYFQWIDNLHDWCISRQIWYGHRIPVWYKDGEIYCGIEAPKGGGWTQDEDTLDTWFSSGLWTFSTLGWPEITKDLKKFHPTSLLETGYDIMFFWVARMILMSTYILGDIPFKTVYFHGLVRDAKGQKMSKSLGNIIDPLDMISKYGADATRLSLIIGTGPGNDSKLSEDKIKAYKHFANKIWNATRFVLSNTEGIDWRSPVAELSDLDKKAIEIFHETIKDVSSDIENYRFYLAGEKMYHYFWHTFADVIIEQSKPRILDAEINNPDRVSCQQTLLYILTNSLKVLHPFMPFITEEIWSLLPNNENKMLIVEKWPEIK